MKFDYKLKLLIFVLIFIPIFINPFKKTTALTRTIVIDPGHGGNDIGASGPRGLRESVVNLAVSKKLKEYLTKAGARVILTRDNNRYLTLGQRVSIARKAKAYRFISIHHNWSGGAWVNGTETYIKYDASNTSYDLAKKVQSSLNKTIGLKNRGVKRAGYYVIKYTKMPAILIEPSFISNLTQENLLRNQAYINKEAKAIFDGVSRHMRLGKGNFSLGIQAGAQLGKEINFPYVVDSASSLSTITLNNPASDNTNRAFATAGQAGQVVSIKFYMANGTLVKESLIQLAANKSYTFSPKKVTGFDFDGWVKVSGNSSLSASLETSNKKKTIVSISQSQPLTNYVTFPHVLDGDGKWQSQVTVVNSSDINALITLRIYNNSGAIISSPNKDLAPNERYSFSPKAILNSNFEGSVEILADQNCLMASLSQAGKNGQAQSVNQTPSDTIYFADIYDQVLGWRNYLAIKNESGAQGDIIIDFFKDKGLVYSKQFVLGSKGVYGFYPSKVISKPFNGYVRVSSNVNISGFQSQNYTKEKDFGIIEAQIPRSEIVFSNVKDSTNWTANLSFANVDSNSHKVNLYYYDLSGKLILAKIIKLSAYQKYSLNPWTVLNNPFIGSIKVVADTTCLVGSYEQTN